MSWQKVWLGAVLASSVSLLGCSWGHDDVVRTESLADTTPLPKRSGTAIADGCELDGWQLTTLAAPETRRVLQTIVLLCLVPRQNGEVGPTDARALAVIDSSVSTLRGLGYRVSLGVSFTDEAGSRFDGGQTAAWLADPAIRAGWIRNIVARAAVADSVDLDFELLPGGARPALTTFVRELSLAGRPQHSFTLWVPPSVTIPSDLPGGDAFDLSSLAGSVDAFRVMTLDYSDTAAGPTIDSGWAIDAARLARTLAPNTPIDLAFPLYGVDFGPRGPRGVSYLEALGLAAHYGTGRNRAPSGTAFFRYTPPGETPHEVWFEDAQSTGLVLSLWNYDVLPANVGISFYGLGAEDPNLFRTLASRSP